MVQLGTARYISVLAVASHIVRRAQPYFFCVTPSFSVIWQNHPWTPWSMALVVRISFSGYHKCAWDDGTHECHDPPGPKPVCNHSQVGFLNLSHVNWGRRSHKGMSKVDYWHGNTLAKTNGLWFSTSPEGECSIGADKAGDGKTSNVITDSEPSFCSWRLVAVAKKVSKACSDAAIDDVIVKGDASASWGARCFNKCPVADRHNTSSQCYIECFYDNVLGPQGSSQLMNHSSPGFGIPLPELRAAWNRPFLPVAQGGCPALPTV